MRRLFLSLGAGLGVFAWLLGIRRSVALDGLARAFPERSDGERRRLARAAYSQLGRSLAEIVAGAPPDIRFEHWELYQQAMAQGHGLVCAIAHYGNFELLARAASRRAPVTLIGRRLRGLFNRWLVESRGIRTLPDRGSSALAVAALRRGEVLAIAVDQNMRPRRGIFVDFFGVPASTTPAAAVYALRAGAPLLAAFPVRQPDGSHVVSLRGPFTTAKQGHAAVVDLTQQLTAAVEEAVREHPDHWFWVHRRWKTRPV